MLNFAQPKEICLRDYQEDAIEALREGIRAGRKRQILCAGTGAGKTVIAAHLLKQAHERENYALFLVDRVALVSQTSKVFDDYGIPHGIVQGINDRWSPRENIQVCSVQTLARRDLPRRPSLIVYDECFPGDVEVLTSGGFKRFDAINGEEDFAQYDMVTESITFTAASRVIQRRAQGDLYRLASDRRINLVATAGHELVVEGKGGVRKKVRMDQFKPGDKRLPVAGLAQGSDVDLSPVERFMIAYQADGSLHAQHVGGGAVAAFSLSKERKIKALIGLAESAELDVKEVAPQSNGSPNAKPRRRFMVSMPFTPHKRVWEVFDLGKVSAGKARDILAEANRWDGHVQKRRETNWIITTTCKRTADFYQAVAALAGIRATMSIVEDTRSSAFSTVYRLFLVTDTRHIGCQKLRPEPIEYDGDVYCVTVPAGCIVVRHHGKTVIVGNCHCQYKATLAYMGRHPDAVKVGLTATPFTKGMGRHWEAVINVRATRRLIEDGYLVEPTIYVAKSPEDAELGLNSYGEFSDQSATAAGIRIVGDVVSEWEKKAHEHFNGPAKTIVFSPTVEHGRELCAAFAAAGYNFQQISYLDRDDAERAEKIEEFRRPDSLIHGLVSCGVLTKGFDVPDCMIGISCKPYRKSLSSHMQEIGRVMRSHPDKTKCLWLDHSGNVERFALDMFDIWENGVGELDQAEARDKTPRERNQQTREKVVCPECSGALRGNTCMACGWERPARSGIVAVEGELKEFSAAQAAMQPRVGLRAECLKEPRKIWDAALSYTLERSRDEGKARRWSYGIFMGIFPGHKLPPGWFNAAPRAPDQQAYSLIEREVKRFRKRRAA